MKTLVMTFGRFSPPTRGHLKLFKKMDEIGQDLAGSAFVYLSHSYDGKDSKKPQGINCKNPLKYEDKVKFVKATVEGLGVDVMETDTNQPFMILHDLWLDKTYGKIVVVLGDDRADSPLSQVEDYNGKGDPGHRMYYEFEEVTVISAGARDESSEDADEQASASLLRRCVVEDDYEKYLSFAGPKSETTKEEMWNILREEMEL